MISKAGIAIFVFGNKKVGENIVNSNGMEEEFEICLKHNVIPIPIGATGYASKSLYDRVIKKLQIYYPNNDSLYNAIIELGKDNSTKDNVISNTLTAIDILQNI